MALKGDIRIISNFYESWHFLPPWHFEGGHPLKPIPSDDMKAVYIGEGLKEWWVSWSPDEPTKMVKMTKLDTIPVYVEVDKYFENEYH